MCAITLKKSLHSFLLLTITTLSPQLFAQDLVGKVPGELTVSGGKANYSIPISVAPGRGGMQPELSLHFSSGAGNGLLGQGWSLGGLSSVHRCSATLEQDGFWGGTSFDERDRYCLDGQRLIPVNGENGSIGTEYRTEADSYSQIVSVGGSEDDPAAWVVKTKSGKTLVYGTRDYSTQGYSQGTLMWSISEMNDTTGNNPVYFSYSAYSGVNYLSSIVYPGGRVRLLTSSYRPDPIINYSQGQKATMERRLDRIEVYAGDNSTLLKTYQVSYQDQSDNTIKTSRINAISVCDSQDNCLPATTFEWSDSISHQYAASKTVETGLVNPAPPSENDTSPARPLWYLEGFYDVGGDGLVDAVWHKSGYRETNIETISGRIAVGLSSGDGNYAQPIETELVSDAYPGGYYPAGRMGFMGMHDVNQDGLVDIIVTKLSDDGSTVVVEVRLSLGNGHFGDAIDSAIHDQNVSALRTLPQAADLNHDGHLDLVWKREGDSNGLYIRVSLGNGDGTFQTNILSRPATGGDHSDWEFAGLFDINGDGSPDAVWQRVGSSSGFHLKVSLSQGDGSFASIVYSRPRSDSDFGTYFAGMHDVNNDGWVDAVWQRVGSTGSYLWVSLSRGDGGFENVIGAKPKKNSSGEQFAGLHDVNNDGFVDAIWQRVGSDSGLYLWVSLSRGDGSFEDVIGNKPKHGSHSSYHFVGMHDVNNDGMADAVWQRIGSSSGFYIWTSLSQGNGSFEDVVGSKPKSGSNGTHSFYGMHDVDSDGVLDAVWQQNYYSNPPKLFTSQSEYVTARLTRIIDGLGNHIRLTYQPLTDPSVYTKATDAEFPLVDVLNTRYVVSAVESSDGIGGSKVVSYQYEGLKHHTQGRGSYGFAQITQTDELTHKATIYRFDQRPFPYTGNLLSTEERINGERVSYESQSYEARESDSGVSQLLTTRKENWRYELGASDLPFATTVTQYNDIDSYGNIGLVYTLHRKGDGSNPYTTSEVKQFSNDESSWLLGRVTEASVAFTNPYGDYEQRVTRSTYDPVTGLPLTQQVIGTQSGTVLTATTHEYNAYGQVTRTEQTSPADDSTRHTTFVYDNLGRLQQTCNAYEECETHTYNPKGLVASTTAANGVTTTWVYDSLGRQRREDRADGTNTTTRHHFASSGACGELAAHATHCSVTQSSGSEPVTTQCDALGRELRVITIGFDGREVYKDTEYNSLGLVIRVSREYFAGDYIHWATSEYDPLMRVVRLAEPGPHGRAVEITTEYNGLRTTTRRGPDALETTITHNPIGQKVRVDEETGSYIEYTYNSDGNLRTTTVNGDPATTITLDYDEFGRKIAMNDPDMGQWSYGYNGFGELVSQTDAKGQTSTMQYDLLGRMVERNEAEGRSTWLYGTLASGQETIGQLQREWTENTHKVYQYDALGRIDRVVHRIDDEVAVNLQYTYDEYGRAQRTRWYSQDSDFYTDNVYNEYGYLSAVQGLRAAAESHDYSALQPLISEAVTLADDYLAEATRLRAMGESYQQLITYYQTLLADNTTDPSASMSLQEDLQAYQQQLTASINQGQSSLSTFLGHINNTVDQLQVVTDLIAADIYDNEFMAEQLVVLAEQTLLAADTNFNVATTLTASAAVYGDFAAEQGGDLITYWRAVDADASGRVSAEVYGNGIVNDYAYSQATGQLESIHSSLLTLDAIRHLEYQYDAHNNVTVRHDWVNDIRETYSYDRLDRLTTTEVSSDLYNTPAFNHTQSQTYDNYGNITYKSDVGDYIYGQNGAGPHAVTQAGDNTYVYDANGNMVSGAGRTIEYSSFNKPTQITQDGRSATFGYAADRARYKKINHQGDMTFYYGQYEKAIKNNGDTEHKYYIYAGDQLVAEHIASSTQGVQTRYLHKDALGSVDLVTDAYGNVVDRRSFDAWGKLRDLPWQEQASFEDPLYLTQLPFTNKGYTGHEHMQEVDLIHMNGRMYDATLARFISADPFIQEPRASQSYNRYSYVWNNPMRYTDPTGYFLKEVGNALESAWENVKSFFSSTQNVDNGSSKKHHSDYSTPQGNRSIATFVSEPSMQQLFSTIAGEETITGNDREAEMMRRDRDRRISEHMRVLLREYMQNEPMLSSAQIERLEEDHKAFRERLVAESREDPDAILQLSSSELELIRDHTILRMIRRDVSGYFQYRYSDTVLYGHGLSVRKFSVEGHPGIHYGGDINYLGVGIAAGIERDSRSLMHALIAGWNANQVRNGGGSYNWTQIGNAIPWADYGLDSFRESDIPYRSYFRSTKN